MDKTLAELINDWLQDVLPLTRKDTSEVAHMLKKDALPVLGGMMVKDITASDILKLTDQIKTCASG